MTKLEIKAGTTDRAIFVYLSSSGVPITATVATLISGGIMGAYVRDTDTSATSSAVTAGTPGTWSSWGLSQVDAVKFPGLYQLGLPNTAVATGAKVVVASLYGYSGLDVNNAEIELTVALQQNTAYSGFQFYMVKSTDHVTPLTGAAVAGQVSIGGAGFGNLTNAVAEVGSGWYTVNLAPADLNGTDIALKFTATGADPVCIKVPLSA